MALLISTILLSAFALLAVVDGFYLHIFKYQLFKHQESKFEHLTHTIRAILFPLIVYFLFITQSSTSFYLGITFVALDILVLGIDAFVEKDSRNFMGGLPRWEYILHLFVNGFHFASIAVFFAIKLNFTENGIAIVEDLTKIENFELFKQVAAYLLPGAILLAIIHILTSVEQTQIYWIQLRDKIACC